MTLLEDCFLQLEDKVIALEHSIDRKHPTVAGIRARSGQLLISVEVVKCYSTYTIF